MPAPPDPQTLLQRVLLLERQQGFQNRAAVGGLNAFAAQQCERAGSQASVGLCMAVRVLENYGAFDRRQRELAVSEALKELLTRTTTGTTKPVGAEPVAGPSRRPSITVTPVSPGVGPAVSRPRARPGLSVVHSEDDLNRPVTAVKGIGKAMAATMERVGLRDIRDLLTYFPRAHYDYADNRSISRMRIGEKTTLVGTIQDVRVNRTRRGMTVTTATVTDGSGTVAVRWFNQPYLQERLPRGERIAISGEPELFNGYISFQPRDYELIRDVELTHTGRLVPVYPLTKGLYQRSVRRLLHQVTEEYAPAVVDYLPADLADGLDLPDLGEAIRQYHFPEDEEHLRDARQRVAFDELFAIQLGLLRRKQDWQQPRPDVEISVDEAVLERFCHALPFALTGAQRRVIAQILEDMSKPFPMSRLLQGDVGSGKTVVAAAALLQAAHAGKQSVLMAPTEILAEQHFRTVGALLEPFGLKCELLVGSVRKAQRQAAYEAVATGTAQVIIGTHALIQEGLEFSRLGLAITDEQHRFGVEQRSTLRQKGLYPHILAMTATPIPRTLAMTIYGDLDVSVIDEMPPGRFPIITTWSRSPGEAYALVRSEIDQGRQAFVICPVIEESMETDMRSVMAEHKELQTLVYPDLQVGLLHGRMKPAEKEHALQAFRRGEYHILVATSLVEVGIDVPNATVMVIRDAHRFGLAQLHQFRGRVGRGGDQAYCLLLSPSESEEARERLEAMTATENGFELAEEDLRLRGPGEFWGTRQSGLPELRVAKLGDVETIQLAREAAKRVLSSDPELSLPQHERIVRHLQRFWMDTADLS